MKRLLTSPRTYIFLFLSFVSVIFFIRCYEHEPSADEITYRYVWHDDDPTNPWSIHHDFSEKAGSLSGIIKTQVRHYFEINGRSIVHSIEQAFTGHLLTFSIINTLIFLLFVWLIAYYISQRWLNGNFFLWAGITIALLIFFPYQESLWTSVNYGLNYLWPATMTMGILILWDKIAEGCIARRWNFVIAIFAAIYGWTHEGFVVGMCGGMFIYYCLNIRKFRGQVLYLAIPMWLTATLMVLAPGNLSRFFGRDGGNPIPFFGRLMKGVDNMLHLWLLWGLVIGVLLLLAFHQRKRLGEFVKLNSRLIYVLAVTFIFTLIANTAPYTHTFVELICLILIVRYVRFAHIGHSKILRAAILLATALFIPQQIILARDTITNYHLQRDMVRAYIASPDGLTILDMPNISPTSKPYIRILHYNRALRTLYADAFNGPYCGGTKAPVFVTSADYPALSNPAEFFVPANKFPGNAPVYKATGGQYLWVDTTALPRGARLRANLKPVDWHHDAPYIVLPKFVLMPGSYPTYEYLTTDTFTTRFGQAVYIEIPEVRQIQSIDLEP